MTWSCEHEFVLCEVDAGRPFAGQEPIIDKCEGPAGDFPYGQIVADFFAKHMTDPEHPHPAADGGL
jgi:hypothetical protein